MPQAPQKPLSGANQCSRIEKDIATFKQKHIWPKDWYPIVDKNSPEDRAMTEKMSASWAQFAKTGNPNVSGQANWPIYNLNADVMRNFAYDQETVTGLLKERVAYQMNAAFERDVRTRAIKERILRNSNYWFYKLSHLLGGFLFKNALLRQFHWGDLDKGNQLPGFADSRYVEPFHVVDDQGRR